MRLTTLLAIIVSAAVWVPRTQAVDPPPSRVLLAPVEEQLRYAEDSGNESERLRARVAQQRHRDKDRKRAIFAAGLQEELMNQKSLMVAASGYSEETRPENEENGFEVNFLRVPDLADLTVTIAISLGLALAYYFRGKFFPTPEQQERKRSEFLTNKWK